LTACAELLLVERDLGEQDDVRRVARFLGREAAGCRDPPGVTPHDLHDEYLRRGLRHRRDVEAGLADRYGDVLAHRAEAGTAVRDGKSLSTVFGTCTAWIGSPSCRRSIDTLRHVSAESPPPL
jgi:hypothetical protein